MLSRWRDRWKIVRSMAAFSNPVELILAKLISRDNVVVYRRGPFRLVSFESCGDGTSIRECLQENAYDAALRAVKASGHARTYINIGANVGAFDVAVHHRWGPGTKGIAIEMNPWTSARLASNLHFNRLDTRVIAAAVAGAAGTAEIDVTRSGPAQSLYQSKGAEADRVAVRVMRLADIPNPIESDAVDLLKVDCEGAEYDIFGQATPAELSRFRFIVVEIHLSRGGGGLRGETLIQEICDKGQYEAAELRRACDARLVFFTPRLDAPLSLPPRSANGPTQ
jgi:FkbM family methyltransferase